MDVIFAVLADYANVTSDGKLNIMGIFNEINAQALPWVHPQMQLVFQASAGAAEWDAQKDITVKLLDADGNQVVSVGGQTKIPKGMSGKPVLLNSVMSFVNVKFQTGGDYVMSILIGGETKREVHFRVNYPPPAPPAKQA
jgi:hypothetical protein